MVYLWGGILFIFLWTVPTQPPKEQKQETERIKIGDVDWENINKLQN